jgi:predicted nucleic acid-binding protein
MGAGYLLDSNVLIGYLDDKIPSPGKEVMSAIIDAVPHISVVSQIEVLRFKTTPEIEAVLADFVNCSVIHPLNDRIVQKTIALCRDSKIKLPDAIIAATALLEDFTLITRNTGDFKNIAGLELLNPWDCPPLPVQPS